MRVRLGDPILRLFYLMEKLGVVEKLSFSWTRGVYPIYVPGTREFSRFERDEHIEICWVYVTHSGGPHCLPLPLR